MKFLTKHTTANNPALKIVFAVLFIVFPIIGFVFGMQYQSVLMLVESQSVVNNISPTNPVPSNLIVTPTEIIKKTLSKKFTTSSGKVSCNYFSNWIIKTYNSGEGNITTIQGPKQLLKIIEGEPMHGFDDFSVVKHEAAIAGKLFEAQKYTSQTWLNSFISVKIQDEPYKLYLEYGDAASVGFTGFDQQYKDKVDFESDIQPINEILQTLTW